MAEGFADEREWDLVEVVAKRAIEGEGGAEGDIMGNEMAARRYMAVNAWAWKAIGVVELVSRPERLMLSEALTHLILEPVKLHASHHLPPDRSSSR